MSGGTQAAFLRNRVDELLERDPPACVIVLGDLNDVGFSEPLRILTDGQPRLVSLVSTLPAEERYSHAYLGNAQMLDHILVSAGTAVAPAALDVVHVNTGIATSVSDHDPVLARVSLPWTAGSMPTGDAPPSGGPTAVQLSQNAPNPFNGTTAISYVLPRPGLVQLRIYNTAGQLVRTLVNGGRPYGRHQLAWEATDQAGRRLDSGVYSYQLTTGRAALERRMVLTR